MISHFARTLLFAGLAILAGRAPVHADGDLRVERDGRQKRLVWGDRRSEPYDKVWLVDLGNKDFILLGERWMGGRLWASKTQHLIDPQTLAEGATSRQFYALNRRRGPKAIWSPPLHPEVFGTIYTVTEDGMESRLAARIPFGLLTPSYWTQPRDWRSTEIRPRPAPSKPLRLEQLGVELK